MPTRLCFGGSFNPIHHGHLICARAAAEAAGFQHIVLIPSAQPPHKPQADNLPDPRHRLEMCRLAVAESPMFEVDEVELHRRGPSYTIDTARELLNRGWGRIYWLIGADMLHLLPQWHEPEALLREVHFLIMARSGWAFDWETLPPAFRTLENHLVPTPTIDISATDVRQRLAAGQSIDYLTPPPVAEYIHRHGLYRR